MRPILLALLVVSIIAQTDATTRDASNAITMLQAILLFSLPFTHSPTKEERNTERIEHD
jgi:hypothetical protein